MLRYFLVALLLSSAPVQTKMPRMEDECMILSACDREMMTRYEGVEFVRIPERVRALLCAMQDDIRTMDSDNVLPALSSEMSVAPAAGMHALVTAVVKACGEGCTIRGCDESTDAVRKILQEYLEMLESGLALVACNEEEMTRSCKTKNYSRLTTNSLRVNGSGCFTRNVCIGGQLGVVGDTTLRGNLIVDGTTTFAGGTILGGDLTVEGNLTVDGTSTLVGLVTAEAGISLPNQSNEVSGFAGSNGPLFQHARFWADNLTGQITTGAPVDFNHTETNSTGITLTGGDTINFATAGLYLIEYGINGTTNVALGVPALLSVELNNGAVIPGTLFYGTGLATGADAAVTISAISSVILSVTAGATFTLNVFSSNTNIHWQEDTGIQQAFVNIYQVA